MSSILTGWMDGEWHERLNCQMERMGGKGEKFEMRNKAQK